MRIQIPTDIHSLVQLLHRLGYAPGPMKACEKDGNKINIWFVVYRFQVARVRATLSLRIPENGENGPRRVYHDVEVMKAGGGGAWTKIGDADYAKASLQSDWEYYGRECISFDFDHASGEIQWSEDFHYGHQFPFYRHKPRDMERARTEAEAEANRLRAEWEKADNERARVNLDYFFSDVEGPKSSTTPPRS